MKRDVAFKIVDYLKNTRNIIAEEMALNYVVLYPSWKIGKELSVGDRVKHEGKLYKVVQAHTSQADWKPDNTPSLYTPIGLDEKGYPVWSKPSGAHDAYNTGDIVDYNGTLYKSLIDGNVYSPEEYPAGWEVYEA